MRCFGSLRHGVWVASACLLGHAMCFGALAPGKILVATSLVQTDVQRAVDAAEDGDTVRLPASTTTWCPSASR